jgi:hypothetical protein
LSCPPKRHRFLTSHAIFADKKKQRQQQNTKENKLKEFDVETAEGFEEFVMEELKNKRKFK